MFKKSYGLGNLPHQAKIYADLVSLGLTNIKELKALINQPEYNKKSKTFLLSEVERLTGIPRSSIRDKRKTRDIKIFRL